jgi:hypothetical protein
MPEISALPSATAVHLNCYDGLEHDEQPWDRTGR